MMAKKTNLSKLKKKELLKIMVAQGEEIDALRKENAELKEKLEERNLDFDHIGSIAEASLAVTDIFKDTFNSNEGRRVTKLTLTPPAGINIVIHTGAFNKSKVKKLNLKLGKKGKVTIQKNAWKKTKARKYELSLTMSKK